MSVSTQVPTNQSRTPASPNTALVSHEYFPPTSDTQKIVSLLNLCHSAHYNILTPSVSSVASPFRYRFNILHVNPDPAYGEVFRMGKVPIKDSSSGIDRWVDKFMLSKVSLERIALIIGVNWSPPVPGPQYVKPGMESYYQVYPDYGIYEAIGYLRSSTGEFTRISGLKEIRLSAIQVEIEEEQATKVYSGKWKPKEGQEGIFRGKPPEAIIEILVKREMAQISQHLLALVETGARLRALRSQGIKSTYIRDELLHPFLIVSVEVDPSNSQGKAIIDQGIADLYGEPISIERSAAPDDHEAPIEAQSPRYRIPVDPDPTTPPSPEEKSPEDLFSKTA